MAWPGGVHSLTRRRVLGVSPKLAMDPLGSTRARVCECQVNACCLISTVHDSPFKTNACCLCTICPLKVDACCLSTVVSYRVSKEVGASLQLRNEYQMNKKKQGSHHSNTAMNVLSLLHIEPKSCELMQQHLAWDGVSRQLESAEENIHDNGDEDIKSTNHEQIH